MRSSDGSVSQALCVKGHCVSGGRRMARMVSCSPVAQTALHQNEERIWRRIVWRACYSPHCRDVTDDARRSPIHEPKNSRGDLVRRDIHRVSEYDDALDARANLKEVAMSAIDSELRAYLHRYDDLITTEARRRQEQADEVLSADEVDSNLEWHKRNVRDDLIARGNLRDYFAGQALAGTIASNLISRGMSGSPDEDAALFAKAAYHLADAMLRIREGNGEW